MSRTFGTHRLLGLLLSQFVQSVRNFGQASISGVSNQNVPVETFATFVTAESLLASQLREIWSKKLPINFSTTAQILEKKLPAFTF
jgi:hypothetical protein